MVTTVAEPTPDEQASEGPPGWLLFVAFATAAAVLAFGWVGLLLAVNGWYRPALVFPLGGIVCIALLVVVCAMFRQRRNAPRVVHLVAGLGVASILAISMWNGQHVSQHVQIDRDGGSYTNTGRWIARDGSLEVRPSVGPFAGEPTVRRNSQAVYQTSHGTLQFQFAHLLPVLLAESYSIAGDRGLFHAQPVLGGVALLAFFVLAWRVMRKPWFALAAMLGLALIIPQMAFSRDNYSEIPSQVLLFTALWLVVDQRVIPRWPVALVAGLFLGATQAVRIDATVFLLGIPAMFAVAWLRAAREEKRRLVLPGIGAFVVGLVPGIVLGLVDLTRHSGSYWNDLWRNERKLALGVIASAIASAIAVAVWRRVFPFLVRFPWSLIAKVLAALVAVAGFGAWILRPRLQHLHGPVGSITRFQAAEHVTVDATRLYWERSLSWMSWYLGPLTVAAAILGAALLVRALLLGRMAHVVGPLVVLVPGTALYLWKAYATSDHVWVTRRFLVSAFPALLLLALGLAAAAFSMNRPSRVALVARAGAVIVAVVAVVFPLYTVLSVRSAREQGGFLAVIRDACNDVGPHAALVVLQRDERDLFADWNTQPFRGWCGAEVAVSGNNASTPDSLRRLAREWRARGRRLFIAGDTPEMMQKLVPGARLTPTRDVVSTDFMAQTVTHRPRSYQTKSFMMYVAEVPTG